MSESKQRSVEVEQAQSLNPESYDKSEDLTSGDKATNPPLNHQMKEPQGPEPKQDVSEISTSNPSIGALKPPSTVTSSKNDNSSDLTTTSSETKASEVPSELMEKGANSLHTLASPSAPTMSGDDKAKESNKTNVPYSGDDSKSNDGATEAQKVKPEKRSTKPKKNKAHLRKGKWTPEEEEYTMRIIQHFRTGLLSLPDGHTLRSYLAEKLNCDPMRITKKFSGASCLGKRVYNLCDRSQVSARDLELAKIEVVNLERRFRLRIEHGSSLPVSTHFSERLRNTRSELDHANFMRASYLFVNHPTQDQANGGADFNMPVPQAVAPNSYNNSNFSLAFLQSLANNGQHQAQRTQSIPSHQNFQPNGSLGSQLQFQNPLQGQGQRQANQSLRNGATPFFDVQQQRQSQLNSNLFSALMNSRVPGVGAPAQTSENAQQLSALDVLNHNQNPVLANALARSSMTFNDQSNQMPGHVLQRGPSGMLNEQGNQGNSAMEALAARYNTAALTSKLQQGHGQQTGRNGEYPSSPGREIPQTVNGSKKVRTKEEQAEGRMLLGFLQELQSNHQKAKMSSSTHSAQDSVSTMPQLQSMAASSDGTFTTRDSLNSSQNNGFGKSQKDGILKRGFDISVKKETSAEGSSTVSSYYESVLNNEALSGSSGGSSGDNESSCDDKDDADKDARAGPLRKRFRRTASQSPLQDGLDSQDKSD